ncbi:hypothetical protein J5X84_34300 [Streptosporangiaceae bacterium NEAU-GS5]|nr:hypothetical protein [Streptosporangiaceae bacterium NEAU-GS5]
MITSDEAMGFSMRLLTPEHLGAEFNVDSSEEIDDFQSLVMHACGLLGRTDCRFLVSGFGQDEWPVTVDYDLSAVMEQLPAMVAELRADKPAVLDFYAQGIQRMLEIAPQNDRFEIRCRSGTAWNPHPECELMERSAFWDMLTKLAAQFAVALQHAAPALGTRTPFPDWSTGKL